MIDWTQITLEPGRAMFLASDHTLHSVPIEVLAEAHKIDDSLVVLATNPEQWNALVRIQGLQDSWGLRNIFTPSDAELLSAMAVKYEE